MAEASGDITPQAVEDWFYERDGQPQGPFSTPRIREMATSGALAPDTLVWTERFGSSWKALRDTSLLSGSGSPSLAATADQAAPPGHVSDAFAWTMVA